MRKIFYFIIVASVFVSCSKESSSDKPTVQKLDRLIKVTPQRTRIGDTIVIEGNGLERIGLLYFNGVRSHRIISAEDKKLVAIVPIVNNENVMVSTSLTLNEANNQLNLSIYGLIPLKPFEDNRNLGAVEAVTEDIVYITTSGNRLYKTIDGGYKWEYLKYFDEGITSLSFINESQGWISLGRNNFGYGSLYYTNDGGKSFENIYTTEPYFKPGGGNIMDMHFSSETKGFLLSSKGDILTTEDNSSFDLLYTSTQNNRDAAYHEYNYLDVYENMIGATGENVLITGEGEDIDFTINDYELGKIQIISNNEAYVNSWGNRKYNLNLVNLTTNTWERLSESEVIGFDFSNSAYGVGIFDNVETKRHDVLESINGQLIWSSNPSFLIDFYPSRMSVKGNVGYIGGRNNTLLKFIRK